MSPFDRPTRCMHCKKSLLACGGRCWDKSGEPEKAKTKVKGKDGRTRTVTKKTGNTIKNGFTWCGSCSCRVNNGTCSNVTCSTRRAR